MQIGNPTIAPEMSNLAEANHLLPFWNGKATWLTSVYGRYTTDVITQLLQHRLPIRQSRSS